jgi:hypothetical protein
LRETNLQDQQQAKENHHFQIFVKTDQLCTSMKMTTKVSVFKEEKRKISKSYILGEAFKERSPPLMSSRLSGRYQQVSYHPSTLTAEELPWQKQASNGPYQQNCMIAKTCT